MTPLLSRDESRAIDQVAVEQLGCPSILLMENAARSAVQWIETWFSNRLDRVLVLGGVGNNGGDAWAVTRLLASLGIAEPRCCVPVLVGNDSALRGDARMQWDLLGAIGITRRVCAAADDVRMIENELNTATLVVDGLIGTGLSRPVQGLVAQVIEVVNRSRKPVVSLDVPSGIDASTGQVLGTAIRAAKTVTFAASKIGLAQYPGKAHAGTVVVGSIGVPAPTTSRVMAFGRNDATVAPRAPDAHKASAGWLAIVGGSAGKSGAPVLAGLGAMRTGAGLVTVFAPQSVVAGMECKLLELMVEPRDARNDVDRVVGYRERLGAAVVGPGMGLDTHAKESALDLFVRLPCPAVFDADALTHLADPVHLAQLASTGESPPRSRSHARVLTPHPGEAAKLLQVSTGEVQAHRVQAATEIARRFHAVTVLKGAATVVALPDDVVRDGAAAVRIVDSGTAALATAGTGDVLAGMIAALLLEHPAPQAATLGAWLHGRAGELASRGRDRGMLAHEVCAAIPRAMQELLQGCNRGESESWPGWTGGT
jgi:hydroxyethylthiazole kinase-like uncharacterized protein yjeF